MHHVLGHHTTYIPQDSHPSRNTSSSPEFASRPSWMPLMSECTGSASPTKLVRFSATSDSLDATWLSVLATVLCCCPNRPCSGCGQTIAMQRQLMFPSVRQETMWSSAPRRLQVQTRAGAATSQQLLHLPQQQAQLVRKHNSCAYIYMMKRTVPQPACTLRSSRHVGVNTSSRDHFLAYAVAPPCPTLISCTSCFREWLAAARS